MSVVFSELTPESYLAAATVAMCVSGFAKFTDFDSDMLSKKGGLGKIIKEVGELSKTTVVYIIGDNTEDMEKIVDKIKKQVGEIHIFSTTDSEKLTAKVTKYNKFAYIPAGILEYLGCKLSTDHYLRDLINKLSNIPKNMREKSTLSLGLDAIIDDLVEYDLLDQFRMLAATPIEYIEKIGEAELIWNKCGKLWDAFGYASDSEGSRESK
jgi:hypothetical protein